MKAINWGKLYDNHCACLQGNPTNFCGCRWDNIELCYECLNFCVKDKNTIQKTWILIQLNFGSIKNKIRCLISRFRHRNDEMPF